MSSSRVWLITGTSTGIGRALALAALRRGERVIATARGKSISTLAELEQKGAMVLELDITATLADLHEIAAKAIAIYGKVDVVVNNAGAVLAVGAIEEITPEETAAQFNINIFGALNVARAFLPHMRKEKSGLIIWIGSMAGWRGSVMRGMYAATKHAMRGLAETLDMEVRPFGIRSICLEPGHFRTDVGNAGHRSTYQNRIVDYNGQMSKIEEIMLQHTGKQPGDPDKLAEFVVDIVRQEGAAAGKGPLPAYIPIGPDAYKQVKGVCSRTIDRVETWKEGICSTNVTEA